MVPSGLPNFEIPTGLMATGLRGLRGFGRGLGQVSVEAIATAQFQGQLTPSFLPQQYFQASYSQTPQALPLYLYATQGFASQIAGLLGGSVVSAPPPGNYQGTGIPNAYWVKLPDGSMVLPGNLLQPGTVLGFQDECAAEQYFQGSIPGSELSATCAGGGTGITPTQLAVSQGATAPVTPSGQSTIVGYTPTATTTVQPVGTTPVVPVSVPATTTTVTAAAPTQAVNFTAGDSCSTVQQKIASLQAGGYSNIVIWNMIAAVSQNLLLCSSAEALNPSDDLYAYAASTVTQQPGTVQGTQQTSTTQQTSGTTTTSDNTALYIGIAAVIGLLFLFGGNK